MLAKSTSLVGIASAVGVRCPDSAAGVVDDLPPVPPQLAGAAFVGVFTPTVPVYVAILSAILRIERFTLLKVHPSAEQMF
jgi:drug/metabolite transporter (DMT)-like permease